jgi:peptidyl-prolyl cis-trans isomerase SurA
VLEGLVLNKLMVAKAEIDSVVVEEEMVERELDMRMGNIIAQAGGDERKIEEYYGKTIEEFKDELRDRVQEQLVVQRMQQTITQEISVTPSEVKRFFEKIPKDSLPYFSTEVTIGQIVKKPTISKQEKDRIESLLMQIRQQAIDGTDFQELARTYSQGPSGPRGGNLGMISRGAMVSEFESAALKMKEGEISLPVETEFGFHIIQLLERRGNEYNARHILIMPRFSDDDFEKAGQYLDSLRIVIETDSSYTFDKIAKEYSDDKETSSNGGFVRSTAGPNQIGSNKIAVSDLDPGLFFTMDTMQVGTISRPMRFVMRDGKEAMRIIYYKDKIKPHQANLDQDYQKIYMATMNAKQNKVMSDWFRDAKDDVFIQIDPEYNTCKILQENERF